MPSPPLHLHLVSDSTGETVNSVARAALVQFEDVEPKEHIWALVRSQGQMDRVFERIEEHPGPVLYTIVSPALSQALKDFCQQKGLPCIPVLSRVIREFREYYGVDPNPKLGRQYELDEEYFERVEALNFTLAHDDGQSQWDLADADIVVLGVSRTSKTPTCVYLAHRGYKAANIPIVPGCEIGADLAALKHPFIVGLVISPDRLRQIRQSRLLSLNEEAETTYTNGEQLRQEVTDSRKFFTRHGWPVIDVTRRSVEETAATIIQMYHEHRSNGR